MTPSLLRLRGGRAWLPTGWRDDCDIAIADGVVAALDGAHGAEGETLDTAGCVIAPGFVDLHVHGAGGAMFEDGDRDGIRRIRATLAARGTTALLATIAALPAEALHRAVVAAASAMGEVGGARLLGIHLEGPFLNPRRCGAQQVEWMRPPAIDELDRLQDAAAGAIRLLTLAPELPGALDLIRHARRRGITVSLGHSEATAEQVEAAIAAGATQVTHCFNAMAPLHHREIGLLGVALSDDRLRLELIADGVHVARGALTLAMRSKGAGGWMLVSDGVAAVGLASGPMRLFGTDCIASDAVRLADSGRLAGSCLVLADAVRNLRAWMPDLADEAILAAATSVPATPIGCGERCGCIAVGQPADLVVLDPEWRLRTVILAGEVLPVS